MRSEIRILRVATYPRRGREGVGRASFELSRRLPFETLYVTPAAPDPPLPPPPHMTLLELTLGDRALPDGNAPLPARAMAFARKSLAHTFFFFRGLPAVIRFRPDVVHIHSILPFSYVVLGRLLGARAFVTFHGTDLYRVGRTRVFRAAMRLFDAVFYVSRAMEPTLARCVDPRRLHYTPNGVDLEWFAPSSARRDDIVLTAGVLKWQKGIDVLLTAFASFVRDHPTFRMRVAGDGPLEETCRGVARSLGIEGQVEWLGHVSQEKLADAYRHARVFVLASFTEGLPKVVLEAMASGTPVIATNVGSCAEVVGDAGLIVPPRNPDALRAALARLLEDTSLWRHASDAGPRIAARYAWDIPARTVLRVLSEIFPSVSLVSRSFPELPATDLSSASETESMKAIDFSR